MLSAAGAVLHDPVEGDADTKTTLAGSVSVMVTLAASDNPLAMVLAVMM